MRRIAKVLLMALAVLIANMAAYAQKAPTSGAVVDNGAQSKILANVGWTQKQGDEVPLNLTFKNSKGQTVKLGQYFGKKPVILTLMYFECPMLCGEVINGTFRGLSKVKFKAGKDFQYVAVSINPDEGPKLAAKNKAKYLKRYKMQTLADGFHFLTGEKKNIKTLAEAVGFRYGYNPETKTYAHPAGIMIITPDGHISHYVGGVNFRPQDLRLGLVASSQGQVGSAEDLILLKCCTFDPQTGKYNFAIQNLLRLGGTAIILVLGILVFVLTRKRRNSNIDKE